MRNILLTIFLTLNGAASAALWDGRSNEAEFFRLERASLEETLNIKTSVASKTPKSLRRTPGLVTVITREEIQSYGARDLADVLAMVPELDFGVDVFGNLGLGVRGNWANEGKALVIWDGQVFNETLYSTVQFDRFPVDQIEEIEIIKGPGSVLYGGFAELAVINVKTRAPRSLDGSHAFAAYGQGSRARARTYAGYSFGREISGASFSAKAFWADARRSDRRYTDLSGNSYGMTSNSGLRPSMVNIYAEKSGTSLRLLFDDYHLRNRDNYDNILTTGTSKIEFPSVFAEVRHRLAVTGDLYLEPLVSYAGSRAWLQKNEHGYYDKSVRRTSVGLTAFYRQSPLLELLGGGEYFLDEESLGGSTEAEYRYSSGKTESSYHNASVFGQADVNKGPLGITAGARYEKHSHYGSAAVPRFAVTYSMERVNFKAIYSQAFRAPSIENMRLNPAISPERSYSGELEAGYKASDNLFLSGSIFQTIIKDPIIYGYTGSVETYTNYSRTGTRGLGLTLKYKRDGLRADIGYIYYEAAQNRVPSYTVPGHGSSLLAFPKHKVTLNYYVPLGDGIGINPSAIYLSRRYGLDSAGAAKTFGERIIAGLNLQLKERPFHNLTLSLGIRDIFQSNYSYIQPYDGGHAALPAPSREVFIKASYEF